MFLSPPWEAQIPSTSDMEFLARDGDHAGIFLLRLLDQFLKDHRLLSLRLLGGWRPSDVPGQFFARLKKTGASKEIRTEQRWKISTILGAVMDHSLKHMRGRRVPKVNDFAIPKHVENHHQRSSWLLDAGVCSWGRSWWRFPMGCHGGTPVVTMTTGWSSMTTGCGGGTWYTSMTKGNLHIPSTASPGRWTFGQPSALEKFSPAIGAIFITHRIHGAAIYGNMDPINIPQMLAYIPAPWILWVIFQLT